MIFIYSHKYLLGAYIMHSTPPSNAESYQVALIRAQTCKGRAWMVMTRGWEGRPSTSHGRWAQRIHTVTQLWLPSFQSYCSPARSVLL